MTVSSLTQPFPDIARKGFFPPISQFEIAEAELIDNFIEEEDPPLESDWHVAAMVLLLEIMEYYWKDRSDVYISGNTAVRFDPFRKKNRNFRGPDFYVIKGVAKNFRKDWVTWEEGDFTPDFVIELASKTTVHVDLSTKKTIYEQDLKTAEYMVYDPVTDHLQGWRLKGKRYRAIKPNKKGWLWSEELGLWVGIIDYHFPRAKGAIKTPRFFAKDGQLILTLAEAADKRAETERRLTEAADKRAETERQLAEAADKRAETERQLAKTEAQARREAEAEIARLRALLGE